MAFVSTSMGGIVAIIWFIFFAVSSFFPIRCPRCGGLFRPERHGAYSLSMMRDDLRWPEECSDCGLKLYDTRERLGPPRAS
jgi:hypothetical protein